MDRSFLDQIDWRRPWLAPYLDIAAPIVQADDWRSALNAAAREQGLRNHRDLPIRFVLQSDLPTGVAYETYISQTGCVPTRDNLHDFFNALVWLAYPQTKSCLNALQAAAIVQAGGTAVRGRLRDAITIFDENAALFVTHDEELIAALREHRWKDLLIAQRAAFGPQYTVLLFGHALMEKLVHPYKAITAHAWPVPVSVVPANASKEERHGLDAFIAGQLSGDLATEAFMPLPVLGLPGWSEGQDETFYGDAQVFRARRLRHHSGTQK